MALERERSLILEHSNVNISPAISAEEIRRNLSNRQGVFLGYRSSDIITYPDRQILWPVVIGMYRRNGSYMQAVRSYNSFNKRLTAVVARHDRAVAHEDITFSDPLTGSSPTQVELFVRQWQFPEEFAARTEQVLPGGDAEKGREPKRTNRHDDDDFVSTGPVAIANPDAEEYTDRNLKFGSWSDIVRAAIKMSICGYRRLENHWPLISRPDSIASHLDDIRKLLVHFESFNKTGKYHSRMDQFRRITEYAMDIYERALNCLYKTITASSDPTLRTALDELQPLLGLMRLRYPLSTSISPLIQDSQLKSSNEDNFPSDATSKSKLDPRVNGSSKAECGIPQLTQSSAIANVSKNIPLSKQDDEQRHQIREVGKRVMNNNIQSKTRRSPTRRSLRSWESKRKDMTLMPADSFSGYEKLTYDESLHQNYTDNASSLDRHRWMGEIGSTDQINSSSQAKPADMKQTNPVLPTKPPVPETSSIFVELADEVHSPLLGVPHSRRARLPPKIWDGFNLQGSAKRRKRDSAEMSPKNTSMREPDYT